MLGRQERGQDDLFVAGSLKDLIPDDHILKRVNRVVDLSWLRDEVRDRYDEQQGRPSIDPEAAVRLMLAGLFHGITEDRKLMREAQVNLAIRWFAGYRLHERLPHHSSLTRIRQRWGETRFKQIFRKSVEACAQAGLVDGETVHIDATLIRADVSWESLTERHVEQILRDNPEANDDEPSSSSNGSSEQRRGKPKKPAKAKKYSPTDPDATLTTSCKQYRMEPCYKQHTAVDDQAGVIVDVDVTTGETSEGRQLQQQIERVEANTGTKIDTLTADGAYAHGANYAMLEERKIQAVIPPQTEAQRSARIPARRFRYDGWHKLVRCPAGKVLRRSTRNTHGWVYRAKTRDCRTCPLRPGCISPKASSRIIVIGDGYEALLRARRRHRRKNTATHELYCRHRWRAEGVHGEAKTQHGLRRAARRGLWNVAIQAYLTAAAMNLKRLAVFLRALICRLTSVAVAPYRASPAGRPNREELHTSGHRHAIAAR
jgi:transposase